MKSLLTVMIVAMLNGSAVAAQYNNPYSSNDDAQQGLEASTFVLAGSGLLGLGIGLKKVRKQKERTVS
jgi:hypothetical protein